MMDNWQFFLQKEGDYAWLPLETPQVEILEGRYQLIARTQAAGSSVRVHIRHQYEQEDIPQENIQESVRQADLSGKVEILPSVYLGLGVWSLSCQPLEEKEPIEREGIEPVTYGLKIQVLPQDFDLFDGWNFSLEDEPDSTQEPSFLPEEISLADLSTDASSAVPAAPVVVTHDAQISTDEPSETKETEISLKPEVAPINESIPESASRFEPDNLRLPTFSADTPMAEFRIVSSKELPRLVSDSVVLESDRSPQLPPFSRSQSIFRTKQEQRLGSLSKIRFIASVISHQAPSHRDLSNKLPRATRQEKFQSKLAGIAVDSAQ